MGFLPNKQNSDPKERWHHRLLRARLWEATQEQLAGLYAAIGDDDKAAVVRGCMIVRWLEYSDDGERGFAYGPRCETRFCPRCARKDQRRVYGRYAARLTRLQEDNHSVRHIVLTVEDVPAAELRTALRDLWRWYGDLMKTPLLSRVVGSLARLEVTKGNDGRFHPHLHLVLVGGPAIPQTKLSKEWKEISGASVVWVRRSKRPLGDLKYILKPDALDEMTPEEFSALLTAFAGLRSVRSAGLLRKDRFEKVYGPEPAQVPELEAEADEPVGDEQESRHFVVVASSLPSDPRLSRWLRYADDQGRSIYNGGLKFVRNALGAGVAPRRL